MIEVNYVATPTACKFHHSNKVVRGFKGPVGNGKSVCCINEGLRLSFDQWPNSEGIRKSRGIIVRNTGPELRTTVVNTWKQWVPDRVAPVVMHPVITCKMSQPMPDNTTVEMEVYFLALDSDADVKKLLSLECTWMFLNETRELPYSVVKAGRERIGRYPAVIDGYMDVYDGDKLIYDAPKERDEDGNPILDESGDIQYTPCKRKALLMDTNPPDDDHWWYQLAEDGCLKSTEDSKKAKAIVETAKIFDFFDGPPPLIQDGDDYIPNPEAENIKHLPGGYQYYLDMIAGNTQDHINVMVLGNYGAISEGRLIYSDYNDTLHCRNIEPIQGLPIGLGWDFGLTPCIVVGQLTDTGQLRILDEVVSDDMDVRTFARDKVKPFLDQKYKGYEIAFSMADPAGNNRGEGEGKSSIGILNDEYLVDSDEDIIAKPLNMGFKTEPAPTNDPTQRIDAVKQFMGKLVNGEPGYILDKRCTVLRKGKTGGYCLKRVAISGQEEKYRDKPDKNKFSHSADAEQYLTLGFTRGYIQSQQESVSLNFAKRW